MKEQAFSFGNKMGLSGIITDPGTRKDNLPGLIILNSGLIPRFGPNRLSVALARRMARHGFTSLRFDFSGIGESRLRDDHLPFAESAPREVCDAMDFFQKARGVTRFVLTGICSGADTAFFVALQDERVCGIIPVDFYGVGSIAYQLKNYRRRLLQPRSWMNLATGKSDLWNVVGKLPEKLRSASKELEEPPGTEETGAFPSAGEITDQFRQLFERGLSAYLLYSAGSPAYYNYETSFKHHLGGYCADGRLRVTYLSHADHGFTLTHNQELFLENIEAWLTSQ